MPKATTSSSRDDRAPSTPQEKAAAAEYGKRLDAELDAEFSREDGVDAKESEKEEPAEKPDSENETEQEQEKAEESSESQTSEEAIDTEKEPEPTEDPKEKRYREQLAGERKANAELQARLQYLEAKIVSLPQQQKEMTPEEQQFLEEKQLLKEKYGLVERQEVVDLLDARLKPVQKKQESSILQSLYTKFPDISPDKDSMNEKWDAVTAWVKRILPADQSDPSNDYEERFELAHDKVFGKKTFNGAQSKQNTYANIGGGSSAAKSRTTVGKDKDAHLSPEARAYKAQLDAYFEDEEKQEEARKKRK